MNILEFNEFKLGDAVKFHNELNPVLFDDTRLRPEIRRQLLTIAQDFMDHLGLDDLEVKDVTLSGSNAAYTYTPHSDIDLHIIVDKAKLDNDEVYRELFNAKKTVYNDTHDITIGGYDVELYVQMNTDPVVSLGEYSVKNNRWIKLPTKRAADFKQTAARKKFQKLAQLAQLALMSNDTEKLDNLLATIKKYRQAGLDAKGEFSPENLAFKALRSQGIMDQLYDHRGYLHSQDLSLDEHLAEASGYIPSESEKNDPRWKTALTRDVRPGTMKQGAKAMGLGNISRAGIPQTANPSGKFKR